MPTLEDKESSATTKVLALLDKQIAHLNLLHPEDEHPVVGNRVDAAIVWIGVSKVVLGGLANAARRRSESSMADLAKLRAFVEDSNRVSSPAGQVEEREPGELVAAEAQEELVTRARELLRPVEEVHLFDRSVALKVWSEFRRVFGAAAKSRDFAGLSEAIEAFVRAGVEKAAGIEFLSLFYELLNALRKHQKDAMAASELFKFLDALSYVYARTSLLAQCTTIRLRSRPQVLTDSEVSKLAHQEVMGYFAELLQSRRQPKVHV